MKNLPKRLKVGYFTITIKYVNDLRDEEGGLCMGLSDTDTQTMFINLDYPDQVVKETILHEAMHFLANDSSIFPSEDIEEDIIRFLSPKTMELLNRNKKFARFLISNNTGEKYDLEETEKGEDRKESGTGSKESRTGSQEGNSQRKEGSKERS
jgi:hypothetical protein